MPAVIPVIRTLTVREIDDAISGLWAQYRAYTSGVANGIRPLDTLALIDELLDTRLALT